MASTKQVSVNDVSIVDGVVPNMIVEDPAIKNVANKSGTTYVSASINYMYTDDAGGRVAAPFLIEHPETVMPFGLSRGFKNEDGSDGNPSFRLVFDTTPESQACLGLYEAIYSTCVKAVGKQKMKYRQKTFKEADPESIFRNPVFRKCDTTTGEILKNCLPSVFVKVIPTMAKFVGLDGEPVEYKMLMNSWMRVIPLVKIESLYSGTRVSLQIKLMSCVIIEAQKGQNYQIKTIAKYNERNPEAANKYREQMNKMLGDISFASDASESGDAGVSTSTNDFFGD